MKVFVPNTLLLFGNERVIKSLETLKSILETIVVKGRALPKNYGNGAVSYAPLEARHLEAQKLFE